jgi:LIVCS family branched-chain amino acid:cation transporter
MFFGAGNLVFSLKIGQATAGNWIPGFLGLILSDVVLSFFGLFFVIKRHNGNSAEFFGEVGTFAKIALPFLALSLLGPFGVAPRCIAVAYGGMRHLIPELPLWAFSAMFCAAAFFIGLSGQRVVNVIGKCMAPILLASMGILFVSGAMHPHELEYPLSPMESLREGFVTGYQTMDLLLAFFAATLIFSQIRESLPSNISKKDATKIAIKSSIFASILLALVYFCMVFLGSHFAFLLRETQPSAILVTIANHLAGNYAALFIAVIMTLACFTSVAPLNAMYTKYMHSLLKLRDDRFGTVLLGTTVASFSISLFDFGGIVGFLAPALEALYPSIVVLTAASIFIKKRYTLKKILFYGVLGIVLLRSIFHSFQF